MLTFSQFVVEHTNGVEYHLTPFGDGSHTITAYHRGHQKGTSGYSPLLSAAVKHPKGFFAKNVVGYSHVISDDGVYKPLKTEVHPKWRRQGIASTMYDRSKAHTGKDLHMGDRQTKAAKSLWSNRNTKSD